MPTADSRTIVETNARLIEGFLTKLNEADILTALTLISLTPLGFGPQASQHDVDTVRNLWQGLLPAMFFADGGFSLYKVIRGADSCKHLVKLARQINPTLLPAEAIPSDSIVTALLDLCSSMELQRHEAMAMNAKTAVGDA